MDTRTGWRRLTRRDVLRLMGATAGATALAACAPISSSPSASASASAAGKPKSGGSIRVYAPEPATPDPHQVNLDYWNSLYQAYDPLVRYDASLKPQPWLAESWDVSSDLKQVKLNLRKGVQFHTGRELTSDDVKYNLLRVRDQKRTVSQIGSWSSWFPTIELPDKNSIVLKSELPRPAMFDLFEYLNITDPQTMDAIDTKTSTKLTMVGTGPYKVAEWVPGQYMQLVKNPSYFRSGQPYLEQIRVVFGTDLQVGATQLEAGAIDDLPSPSLRDAARLAKDPKYRVTRNELSGMFWLLVANASKSPTDDKRIRQAINYAINRKYLAETILLGQVGTTRDLPWPAHSPAAEPSKNDVYAYDLDKAKSLLGGQTLEMEIVDSPLTQQINDFAQVLQADLQKIGIKTTIKNMERAAFTPYTRGLQYKGIQLGLGGFSQVSPSAAFASSFFTNVANGNSHGIKSPEYDSLIAGLNSETDPAKQKTLYSQMNAFLLDQSVQMPMAANQPLRISRAALKGQKWRASECPMYEEWWLDE